MDKEKELFRLKDVHKFLDKHFDQDYKFISLKRVGKNFISVCIEKNGEKIYFEFTPYDLKMFTVGENFSLTKVSEN